jgi:hypothetical protein
MINVFFTLDAPLLRFPFLVVFSWLRACHYFVALAVLSLYLFTYVLLATSRKN